MLLQSCETIDRNDLDYIRSKVWQYDDGYAAGEGDFIEFGKGMFDLKGDTIFRNNIPKAIVTGLDTAVYDMTIISIKEKLKGRYRNIEESLK